MLTPLSIKPVIIYLYNPYLSGFESRTYADINLNIQKKYPFNFLAFIFDVIISSFTVHY